MYIKEGVLHMWLEEGYYICGWRRGNTCVAAGGGVLYVWLEEGCYVASLFTYVKEEGGYELPIFIP